jgi:hypothetical protein
MGRGLSVWRIWWALRPLVEEVVQGIQAAPPRGRWHVVVQAHSEEGDVVTVRRSVVVGEEGS